MLKMRSKRAIVNTYKKKIKCTFKFIFGYIYCRWMFGVGCGDNDGNTLMVYWGT